MPGDRAISDKELSSMLNRIRRAVSLARARHFPKGRHRRPLTVAGPAAAFTSPAFADASTVILGPASVDADRRLLLTGEDIALHRHASRLRGVFPGVSTGRPSADLRSV
jgi:hypothetical protein